MVADPTVLVGVLIVLAVAIILAVAVGSFDIAPLATAVLGSVALGVVVLADSVILLYYLTTQPNSSSYLAAFLLVLLPGLGALFAAVLTLIGILAGLIWCVRHRRFGGWGFPLLLGALVVELAGMALISSVEAGAAFVPPLESSTLLGNNALEAIAVGCMTLAAFVLCVGAFVTLHRSQVRGPASSIVLPGTRS